MSGYSRQRAYSELRSGARASEPLSLFGPRPFWIDAANSGREWSRLGKIFLGQSGVIADIPKIAGTEPFFLIFGLA